MTKDCTSQVVAKHATHVPSAAAAENVRAQAAVCAKNVRQANILLRASTHVMCVQLGKHLQQEVAFVMTAQPEGLQLYPVLQSASYVNQASSTNASSKLECYEGSHENNTMKPSLHAEEHCPVCTWARQRS